MTDIFISYASKNKNVADNLCAKLEQQQLKCWIAPRDIKPGEEYASGIVRGIDNCKCMVLVFSEASNASKHVLREVERAIGAGATVIPFRIDDIMPTDSMDYFLKVAHWLDAKDMKMDDAINKLTQTVASILEQPVEIKPTTSVPSTPSSTTSAINKLALPAILFTAVALTGFWYISNDPIDDNAESQLDTITNPNEKRLATPEETKKALLAELVGQNKQLLSDASLSNVSSALDISSQLPNRELKLKAWVEPERSQFMQGDKVKFKTNLSQDAYLAVYVHSMDGGTYLIYPNHLEAPTKITKDQVFTVGSGSAFELEIAEPFGVDLVQFIATNDEKEYKHLLAKNSPIEGMNIATANRAEIVKEMSGIRKRGIKVVNSKTIDTTEEGNRMLWGESVVLLNTKKKQ